MAFFRPRNSHYIMSMPPRICDFFFCICDFSCSVVHFKMKFSESIIYSWTFSYANFTHKCVRMHSCLIWFQIHLHQMKWNEKNVLGFFGLGVYYENEANHCCQETWRVWQVNTAEESTQPRGRKYTAQRNTISKNGVWEVALVPDKSKIMDPESRAALA